MGSDWSRTTKVFFSPSDTVPTISKCQDVRAIFPNLVSNNNDNENVQESGGNSVTYYVEYNYQYPNGERLRMQFDLQYPDTTSAQNGNNFNGGEFSFTPTGANGADVSSSLENKVTKAYRQIVETYGSPGEDDCNYSSGGGSSGSSRSSGGNSSVGSFIVPNIILLLSLIVVFGF